MSNGKFSSAKKQLLRTPVLKKSPTKFLGERGYREEPSKADLSSSEEVERLGRSPTGDMHLSCGIPV
jgi:hypothetical protein